MAPKVTPRQNIGSLLGFSLVRQFGLEERSALLIRKMCSMEMIGLSSAFLPSATRKLVSRLLPASVVGDSLSAISESEDLLSLILTCKSQRVFGGAVNAVFRIRKGDSFETSNARLTYLLGQD